MQTNHFFHTANKFSFAVSLVLPVNLRLNHQSKVYTMHYDRVQHLQYTITRQIFMLEI